MSFPWFGFEGYAAQPDLHNDLSISGHGELARLDDEEQYINYTHGPVTRRNDNDDSGFSGFTSPWDKPIVNPFAPTSPSEGATASAANRSYTSSYPRPQYPPVSPADQNPPCNTLYVGNLPIDTSEDELQSLFSRQRGFKRLCFRLKQNGPMCFVEFEDVSFATKALNELYGYPLQNSVKGGIRLSFSKTPLGVRTGRTDEIGPNAGMAPEVVAHREAHTKPEALRGIDREIERPHGHIESIGKNQSGPAGQDPDRSLLRTAPAAREAPSITGDIENDEIRAAERAIDLYRSKLFTRRSMLSARLWATKILQKQGQSQTSSPSVDDERLRNDTTDEEFAVLYRSQQRETERGRREREARDEERHRQMLEAERATVDGERAAGDVHRRSSSKHHQESPSWSDYGSASLDERSDRKSFETERRDKLSAGDDDHEIDLQADVTASSQLTIENDTGRTTTGQKNPLPETISWTDRDTDPGRRPPTPESPLDGLELRSHVRSFGSLPPLKRRNEQFERGAQKPSANPHTSTDEEVNSLAEAAATVSELAQALLEESEASVPEPAGSTSKKRRKTGCLTCRKRRIKCGEERPICKNCIKSKRDCEGYNQRQVFKAPTFDFQSLPDGDDHITLPQNPKVSLDVTPQAQVESNEFAKFDKAGRDIKGPLNMPELPSATNGIDFSNFTLENLLPADDIEHLDDLPGDDKAGAVGGTYETIAKAGADGDEKSTGSLEEAFMPPRDIEAEPILPANSELIDQQQYISKIKSTPEHTGKVEDLENLSGQSEATASVRIASAMGENAGEGDHESRKPRAETFVLPRETQVESKLQGNVEVIDQQQHISKIEGTSEHFQREDLEESTPTTMTQDQYTALVNLALGADVIAENGEILDADSIKMIADDLSWMPVYLARVLECDPFTWSDCVKGLIEDTLGETWDWWPLRQRKRPLQADYSRLCWSAPSGLARHVDLPHKAATAINDTFAYAPTFVKSRSHRSFSRLGNREGSLMPVKSIGLRDIAWLKWLFVKAGVRYAAPKASFTKTANSSPGSGSAPSAPTGPNSAPSQASSSNHQLPGGPTSPSQQQGGNTSGSGNPTASSAQQASQALHHHVYLCVKRGSSHRFSAINISHADNDPEFFTALKRDYCHLRGWFLRFFSWWRYDKCDFYEFLKYGIDTGAPIKISYPPKKDLKYDFHPRPISPYPPTGPISKHEFRHRFYTSPLPIHNWYLFHLANRTSIPAARDVIPLLPKRKTPLELDDGKREFFFGIYARERRAFAWVLAYGLLCNSPAIVFFWMWLFSWGHGADLQNASVPLTMSISLTMFFLAMLREEKEGER